MKQKQNILVRLDSMLLFAVAFGLAFLLSSKAEAFTGAAAAARAIGKAAHKNCTCRGRKSGNSFCSSKNITKKVIVERSPARAAGFIDDSGKKPIIPVNEKSNESM